MRKLLRRLLYVDVYKDYGRKHVYVNTTMGNVVFRRIDCIRDSLYNLIFWHVRAFRWKRFNVQ